MLDFPRTSNFLSCPRRVFEMPVQIHAGSTLAGDRTIRQLRKRFRDHLFVVRVQHEIDASAMRS